MITLLLTVLDIQPNHSQQQPDMSPRDAMPAVSSEWEILVTFQFPGQ